MFKRLTREWKNPSFSTRQLVRALMCTIVLIVMRTACYVFGWDPDGQFMASSMAGLVLAALIFAAVGITALGRKGPGNFILCC